MKSITDTTVHWPSADQFMRVLTLSDHNTRVVVIGVVLLGIAGGIVGTFMLLRKRALMGDAVSHATLPGIGIAFLVMTALGGTGRSMPGLLLGATISGLAGMGAVLIIRSQTRLKEDAALGIVLSVFFGLGIAVLGIIQQQTLGHAAGLESFIYGKTASMLTRDAYLIGGVAGAVTLLCLVFYKEFAIVCFDQDYASSQGLPTLLMDVIMMGLVVIVTVIGLQAVGLILMIALLIIPPAAARFWTQHLSRMIVLSAVIGGASCLLGAALSALLPRMPTGAIIVVMAGVVFFMSMIFGTARGVLRRWYEHHQLRRRVRFQHLLRALYEWNETRGSKGVMTGTPVMADAMPWPDLRRARSWSSRSLRRVLRRARRKNFVQGRPGVNQQLTTLGLVEARRVVRNHRLWETYLITHADIALVHVDSNADEIEHVLGPTLVARLEALVVKHHPEWQMPQSPHAMGT